MRLALRRAGGVVCLLLYYKSFALAADFYPLGDRSAFAVSADGGLVLTSNSLWTPGGGHVQLLPSQSEVYPRDIANTGLVAGLWCGPNTGSCYQGFVAPINGPVQGLGAFDNFASDAFAMTPDGRVVVGRSSSADGEQAFRWTSETGLIGLGHLVPGETSQDTAFGVSADGSIIVGQSGGSAGTQAFRWTSGTGMVGLGDLPGGESSSTATAISANGLVIAGTGHSASGTEAFRWTQPSGMVGLGDLHAAPFHTEVTAISADGGTIYGFSSAPDVNEDAWVWTESAGMRKFQDVLTNEYGLGPALAGWRLWRIDDVSDDDLVLVGNGRNPQGDLEGFVVVIPEPATLTLGILAAVALGLSLIRIRSARSNRTASF